MRSHIIFNVSYRYQLYIYSENPFDLKVLDRPYINLGCWTDKEDRAISELENQDPILDGDYQTRRDALRKCAEASSNRGFTVFALQDGGWCASSCDAKATYKKYGQSTNCQADGKGGAWANQVYEQKLQGTINT